MNEKQKNKSMVNAFGTGKPPVATVRRRDEDKQQQRARRQGVDPNSDINAVFNGVQQMRTRVHRGMSGMPLNPDGTDPGNSFDRFMRQNPHLQGAAQRQAQYDQQARGNAASAVAERKALQGMDMLFPGKSSPPGGGQGDRVGSSNPSGEPGGETLFGQMPNVQGKGMPEDYNRTLGYGPNAGPQADWNAVLGYNKPNQGPQPNWNAAMGYGPNSGPQQYAMGPNEGPQRPADFGPQLPYSSGEQLMALKRLSGFGGNTNPTSTALEGIWSNIFPGVKDYDYLRQLFPGLVHPQAGSGQIMASLAKMYQNPAYQALFPNVNQSEFYR